MQDYLKPESNDEIDLRELFITLWAYKLFIACACAFRVVFFLSVLKTHDPIVRNLLIVSDSEVNNTNGGTLMVIIKKI